MARLVSHQTIRFRLFVHANQGPRGQGKSWGRREPKRLPFQGYGSWVLYSVGNHALPPIKVMGFPGSVMPIIHHENWRAQWAAPGHTDHEIRTAVAKSALDSDTTRFTMLERS